MEWSDVGRAGVRRAGGNEPESQQVEPEQAEHDASEEPELLADDLRERADQEASGDRTDLEEHRERADGPRPVAVAGPIDGQSEQRRIVERHAEPDEHRRDPQCRNRREGRENREADQHVAERNRDGSTRTEPLGQGRSEQAHEHRDERVHGEEPARGWPCPTERE